MKSSASPTRRLARVLGATVAILLLWAVSAQACATPEFLGDYPKDEELPWSENVQGVAHDNGNWFFTNQDSLLKLPDDFPLHEDPDFVDSPRGEMIRKLKTSFVEKQLGIEDYPELAERGIDHFGDIDHYGGLVFAPLQKPLTFDEDLQPSPARSFIAAFRASDLEIFGVDGTLAIADTTASQGASSGWLAIDPWTGYLYSSPSHVQWKDPDDPEKPEEYIHRYRLNLSQLKATGNLQQSLELVSDKIELLEPDGTPLARGLRHMQGGTFTPWGDLVIENGFIDESIFTQQDVVDRGGIHIFRPVGGSRNATQYKLVEESVNQTGLGGFKFAYDADANDEEPEGLDWWNRGPETRPSFAQGQLHATMVDNTQFANGESDPDDLYFKHYFVDYSCLPDFDGDGVATSAEVDSKGTDPLNPDTDGDGLSDKSDPDPKDPDSDDDGTPDGAEDSDGDGLTDAAEVNTHGTDPNKADSDGDGLNDGAEVNTYDTDPLDTDSDDDGFGDGFEVDHGTDPKSGDSDGDGLPDGRDVEFVQNAIAALPASAFRPPGSGTKKSMLTALEDIESLLVRGRPADAIKKLRTLRTRVDGCGTKAANDDWIIDCAAQREIRELIDLLLANLGA